MKSINLPWINGRDVPTDESILAHGESLGREKLRPDFFKLA